MGKFALCTAFLGLSCCYASPLLEVYNTVSATYGQGSSQFSSILAARNSSNAGPLSYGQIGQGQDPASGLFNSYNLLGTATYGSLSILDSVLFSASVPLEAVAGTSVSFRDDVTITAPGASGTGTVAFTLAVSGNARSNVSGASAVNQTNLSFLIGVGGLFSGLIHEPVSGSVSTSYTSTPFVFTYGQPFELQMTFGAEEFLARAVQPTCLAGCGYSGSAVLDFAHTAVLSGIQVYDSSGQPMGNAFIQSAAGGPYANIPEPGSFWMVLIGALLIVVYRPPRRLSN